jgi:Peptidase M66
VLTSFRLTVGIGLLLALFTACNSDPKPSQKPSVPGFNLTLEPTSIKLIPGDTTEVGIKLERVDGFTDAVAVTLKGLPSDVSVSPAAINIEASASSATVRLSASAAAKISSGNVTLEGVSGAASGGLQGSAVLGLTVLKPLPSFNLSFNPANLTLTQGDAIDVTVQLERLNGFSDPVTVTLKGLPSDVTASPASLTIPATASSASVRLSASATAGIASSTLTAVGTGGTLQKNTSLILATLKPDPSKPDVYVKRLEWGQSILKSDLRLVAGKPAVLRAYVNATQAGITGVIVRATASVNGATLGTLDLTAPSSVPITDTATSLASTYWGVLPKDWIKSGLEVKLEVDATRSLSESNEANNVQVLKPAVGTGNKLYLTMVPIIQGGKTAQTLDAAAQAELKAALMRYWPLADVDIQVRAPYTIKSDGMTELIALRTADGSKRYYYGFEESCCGVGYVGYPVAAGNANPRTIGHELGHNFGRNHAPCGPSDPDVNYPNNSGKLDFWGLDPRDNSLVDPTGSYDLMSYCGPDWVSEYMYSRVQSFLEQNPPGDKASAAASNLLLVSGTVSNGQVSLEPLQRITGAATFTPTSTPASTPTSGQYALRLETASGDKQVSFDLRTAIYEDAAGNETQKSHFSFTMPDPGSISKLTLSENGAVKLEQSAATTLRTQSSQVQSSQVISLQRNGSSVTVTWDAKAYSSVAVAHIAPDGTRTTLALGLTGGTARLELGRLDAGQFEVSASDGLNGIKQRF